MYYNKFQRYKNHFVCLECCKGFKKPNEKDIAAKEGDLSLLLNAFYYSKPKKIVTKDQKKSLAEKYFNTIYRCSDCRHMMVQVPKSFEVPPKSNIKLWNHLRRLYHIQGHLSGFLYTSTSTHEIIELLTNNLSQHLYRYRHPENFSSKTSEHLQIKTDAYKMIQRLSTELKALGIE